MNLELLSIDLPYTYTCMVQVSVNSNVLHTSPSFLGFHIPLIFAPQQLNLSEICTLFQTIKLQIFCILTIMANIFLVSHISQIAKYEKLGKYFPYCTRHGVITTTYKAVCMLLFFFFNFKPLVTPLFLQLFCNNIQVSSKLEERGRRSNENRTSFI